MIHLHLTAAGLACAAGALTLSVLSYLLGGERAHLRSGVAGGVVCVLAGAATGNLPGLGIGVFLLVLCGWARTAGYGRPAPSSLLPQELWQDTEAALARLGHRIEWEHCRAGRCGRCGGRVELVPDGPQFAALVTWPLANREHLLTCPGRTA